MSKIFWILRIIGRILVSLIVSIIMIYGAFYFLWSIIIPFFLNIFHSGAFQAGFGVFGFILIVSSLVLISIYMQSTNNQVSTKSFYKILAGSIIFALISAIALVILKNIFNIDVRVDEDFVIMLTYVFLLTYILNSILLFIYFTIKVRAKKEKIQEKQE